jgi:hypothetical protein
VNQSGPRLPLPKLGFFRLSLYFADLWLVSEGSHEWVKDPRVRRAWHVDFFSVCIFLFIKYVLGMGFLQDFLHSSASATLMWRCFQVATSLWLLATTAWLTYLYYRYLLVTGKDIRFHNVTIFWCTWVLIFGKLYYDLYTLGPSLYTVLNPTFTAAKTYSAIGMVAGYKMAIRFSLYSASTALTQSSFGITSASVTVSALNLVELLGSVLFIALLVSTFVNKSEASRK